MADQRSRIRAWVEMRGDMEICQEIEAIESATCFISERRLFQSAIDAAKEVDGLIVYDIDRFFRNTEDGLRCARVHFLETGKKLIFLNQNLDISSDDGWVMFGMMLLMAEKEAKTTRRRVTCGKTRKKESDPFAYVSGAAPYGYAPAGQRGNRVMVIDQDQYRWRKQIFAWKAEGWNSTEIAHELNRLGVPTKRGKKWTGGTVRVIVGRPLALQPILDRFEVDAEKNTVL